MWLERCAVSLPREHNGGNVSKISNFNNDGMIPSLINSIINVMQVR